MEVQTLKCPNCGGQLEFGGNIKACVCPFCDAVVKLDDGVQRSEHTEIYRDEAELKKLELAEQARIREEKARIQKEKQIAEWNANQKKAFARWYVAVLICVLAFIAVVLVARFLPHEANFTPNFFSKALGVVFLIFLPVPLILPFFYPYNYDSRSTRGLWLKWFLILCVIWFLVISVLGEGGHANDNGNISTAEEVLSSADQK